MRPTRPTRPTRMPALGLVLALVLLATSAQAESVYGRGDPAAYLALSGMVTYDDIEDLKFWEYGSSDSKVHYGLTGRAGFRLGAPLAIEIQGDWNDANAWRDDDNWIMTANFRVYPVQYFMDTEDYDVLQPYGVAGAGVLGGDPQGDKYQLNGAFRVGVGLDFYVTEQVALSAGYEWVTGTGYWSHRDSRNFIFGVQYNFGAE